MTVTVLSETTEPSPVRYTLMSPFFAFATTTGARGAGGFDTCLEDFECEKKYMAISARQTITSATGHFRL